MLSVVVSVEICVSGPPSEEADAEVKLVSTLAPDVKPGVTVVYVVRVVVVSELASTLTIDVTSIGSGVIVVKIVVVVPLKGCVSRPPREEADGEVRLSSMLAPDEKLSIPGVMVVRIVVVASLKGCVSLPASTLVALSFGPKWWPPRGGSEAGRGHRWSTRGCGQAG